MYVHSRHNLKLRQARELRGWTQKELADRIDLPDTRTLRRWESGEAHPSLRYRARLCTTFEMGPEQLGLFSAYHFKVKKEEGADFDSIHISEHETLTATRFPAVFPPNEVLLASHYWNRQRLLKKVYTLWIKEFLEPSLDGREQLTPEFYFYTQAVANSEERCFQHSQQSGQSLRCVPPGTSILQIYDDACCELLILGEPASGKTTLLLELARELLKRALESEMHPIPVILNCSSWAKKRLPLASWLVEELSYKYLVPQRIGQVWVENDQVLLLLDGLDEVDDLFREACIDAINVYREHHGLVSLVLCSRKEEYLNLPKRVLLQQALFVQMPAQDRDSE